MLQLGIFCLIATAVVSEAGILDSAKSVTDAISFFSNKDFNIDQLMAKEESDLTKNLNLVKGLLTLAKTKTNAFKDKASDEAKQVLDSLPKIQEKVDDFDKKVYQDTSKTLFEKIEEWSTTVKDVFEKDKLILVVNLLQGKIPGINAAPLVSCSFTVLLIPAFVLAFLR